MKYSSRNRLKVDMDSNSWSRNVIFGKPYCVKQKKWKDTKSFINLEFEYNSIK